MRNSYYIILLNTHLVGFDMAWGHFQKFRLHFSPSLCVRVCLWVSPYIMRYYLLFGAQKAFLWLDFCAGRLNTMKWMKIDERRELKEFFSIKSEMNINFNRQ